jgi:GTP cyclohydrolase III
VEIGVYTDNVDLWRPIRHPRQYYLSRVGYRNAIKHKSIVWYVPGDNLVATANGWGGSFEEAWENALRVADSIEALETYHGGHEKRKIEEHLRKLKELGVNL